MDTTSSDSQVYRYTRRDHESIQSCYRDRLVLLEGPDAYWTYFQDARTISRIMNWQVYENRRNVPGITFPKEQLEAVLLSLDQNRIGWIVCTPSGERLSSITLSHVSDISEEEPEVITLGSYVRVQINGITERSFLIREANAAPVVIHVSPTGMVKGTELPDFSGDSISVESPAGQALLGRHIGDLVSVPGGNNEQNTYQILGIK